MQFAESWLIFVHQISVFHIKKMKHKFAPAFEPIDFTKSDELFSAKLRKIE